MSSSAPAERGRTVVACLRPVDPRPQVDALTAQVVRSDQGTAAAPAELAALEIAFTLAAALGARVLAVVAGPAGTEHVLREAIALGADAVRVDFIDAGGGEDYAAELVQDERILATAIAAAIRPYNPAVVICGDRTTDRGTGSLPAFLAHELGAAQALGLVALVADSAGLLSGQRRLPGGRREQLQIPLSAVCSVEGAGVQLRRAALPAVLAARRVAIPVATPPPPPSGRMRSAPVRVGVPRPYVPRAHVVPPAPAGVARERLLVLTSVLTDREPPTVIGPLDAPAAAASLLEYLRRNEYLPTPSS